MTDLGYPVGDINLLLSESQNTINQGYYQGIEIKKNCRGCNNNLNGNDPASRYQKLKLIQNTVRVPSSIYTMNLGALNVYEKPDLEYRVLEVNGANLLIAPGVNWNQMSDRRNPHIQKVVSGSGSTYGGNSLKRTLTRLRPGALSPGGVGVDIKHNSYERYLNRIKGKAPLRQGVIPKTFLSPYIPFNRAFPVYGGKLFKTSIINHCDCPNESNEADINLYKTDLANLDNILNVKYEFHIGDKVLAPATDNLDLLTKGEIINIINDNNNNKIITVLFLDGVSKQIEDIYIKFLLYNKCIKNPCIANNIPDPYKFGYISDNVAQACVLSNFFPSVTSIPLSRATIINNNVVIK